MFRSGVPGDEVLFSFPVGITCKFSDWFVGAVSLLLEGESNKGGETWSLSDFTSVLLSFGGVVLSWTLGWLVATDVLTMGGR